MDDITKNNLKSKLPDYVSHVTQPTPKGGRHSYICPLCGSGTGPNATGAFSLDDKAHLEKWHCFACGRGGDIFDLVGAIEGLDTGAAMQRAAELYGQNPTKPNKNLTKPDIGKPKPAADKQQDKSKAEAVLNYIAACASRAGQTDYLTRRGFTPETIKRFNLGYDPEAWLLKDVRGPAIIIPGNGEYYIKRVINPEAAGVDKYMNMKGGMPATAFLGIHHLTEASSDPVFVVEGAFNAISLEQAGAAAISTNSQANKNKFIEYMRVNKPRRPLIVAFDPDEKARQSQSEIIAAAREMGVMAIGFDFSTGTAKDPNDLLQQGISSLTAAITRAYVELDIKTKEAVQEASELLKLEMEAYAQAHRVENVTNKFLEFIEFDSDNVQIPTGFKQLDDVLGGGLTGGSLICIGAISSIGKTTISLQMADQIAAQEQDVLFFTLEMSRFELISKSVSRYTFELAGEAEMLCLSAREVLRYKTWAHAPGAPDKLAHILASSDEYIQRAGRHLYFNEGLKDDFRPFTAIDIEHAVKEHIRLTGNNPVVFIDYLQILGQLNEKGTDKQNTDMNVTVLKRMARQLNIPIIVISALNRENYKAEINMAAFKESGLIEYSSDILLGMQPRLKSEDEKRANFDIDEFKKQKVWPLEIKVLKNRNGVSGGRLYYNCTAKCNHFAEDIPGKTDSMNFNRAGKQRSYI